MIAFTTAVAEKVGPSGRWYPFRHDVVGRTDTAQAVQMRDACDLILKDLDGLMRPSANGRSSTA